MIQISRPAEMPPAGCAARRPATVRCETGQRPPPAIRRRRVHRAPGRAAGVFQSCSGGISGSGPASCGQEVPLARLLHKWREHIVDLCLKFRKTIFVVVESDPNHVRLGSLGKKPMPLARKRNGRNPAQASARDFFTASSDPAGTFPRNFSVRWSCSALVQRTSPGASGFNSRWTAIISFRTVSGIAIATNSRHRSFILRQTSPPFNT